MFLRRLLMVFFLLLGAIFLAFGSAYHTVIVLEDREREVTIVVPSLFGFSDAGFGPGEMHQDSESRDGSWSNEEAVEHGSLFGSKSANEAGQEDNPFAPHSSGEIHENPFAAFDEPVDESPWSPPDAETRTVWRRHTVTLELPERAIVLDVTVGGLTRVNGELKRTYSGQPPAFCPT